MPNTERIFRRRWLIHRHTFGPVRTGPGFSRIIARHIATTLDRILRLLNTNRIGINRVILAGSRCLRQILCEATHFGMTGHGITRIRSPRRLLTAEHWRKLIAVRGGIRIALSIPRTCAHWMYRGVSLALGMHLFWGVGARGWRLKGVEISLSTEDWVFRGTVTAMACDCWVDEVNWSWCTDESVLLR